MFQMLTALVLAGLTTTAFAIPAAAPLKCPNFTPPFPVPPQPKNIIIDSDLLSFTDDAAAIGVANTLQTMGYAKILGIVSDVTSEYSLPSIDAINTWYCNPDIPLAQTKHTTKTVREPTVADNVGEYITQLSNSTRFPEDFKRADAKDPVQFYKEVLTKAPDDSVTIVAIGFLTNLNNLYNSEGGPELIKSKVKELVVQGGSCNTTNQPHSAGYNLLYDLPSAEVVTKWPSPVTFFPGFVAQQVQAGQAAFTLPENSPVRFVYETANFTGNFTLGPHDILATHYAIFGLSSDTYTYGNANGTGGLQFVPNPKSPVAVMEDTVWNYAVDPPAQQHYLILQNNSNQAIADKINGLISCYGTEQPVCSQK